MCATTRVTTRIRHIGPLPGAKLTFRESMATERPNPQQWPHSPYTELVHADILPAELANTVIDCMRAYGATTLRVVANVGRANPNGRAILGFISYGHALQLLRPDREEKFLLFLYSHRFHDDTPGSWTAGEVSGINRGTATFCIPAQQTIRLARRSRLSARPRAGAARRVAASRAVHSDPAPDDPGAPPNQSAPIRCSPRRSGAPVRGQGRVLTDLGISRLGQWKKRVHTSVNAARTSACATNRLSTRQGLRFVGGAAPMVSW
jgi:hypothetical protein